jgi:hypothetical protein
MHAANQYVSRDPLKDAIRLQMSPAAVFIDLSRVSVPELWIERLEVAAHFLARLLEADRSVRLGDSAGPV